MKIIALKQRRHRLTAVYFEKCGDAETIDSETLLMSGYHEGSDISEDDWQELKGEAQRNRAYEKALYLLEYRAHTKKELFTKLRAVSLPMSASTPFPVSSSWVFATTRPLQRILPRSFLKERASANGGWPLSFQKRALTGTLSTAFFANMRTRIRLRASSVL